MPYDLSALERGYGETVATFQEHEILLRYRVDLDGRAMHAMRRALVGVRVIGLDQRVPDTEQVITELVRLLLPAGPDVPPEDRGWDLTRDGVPLEITLDELERLPFQLPVVLLGAIMEDVQNPNRLRLSRVSSKARADSQPTPSPTGIPSSAMPAGPDSIQPSLPDSETLRAIGPVGRTGYGA